jgi:hypothetical protein
MIRAHARLLVPVLAAALLGCGAHVRETHYFRSSEPSPAAQRNYFRVEIHARVIGTKVRYLAGYFDDAAVDQYFAEFTQPESLEGTLVPDGDDEAPSAEITPVDPKLIGSDLVLLLSNNVDEVAAQIGAIGKGQQTQAALANIVNRDQIDAAQRARDRAELDRQAAASVANIAARTAETLDPNTSASQAKADLLVLANALAAYLGADVHFTDLDEAERWLAANRARIQAETGGPP